MNGTTCADFQLCCALHITKRSSQHLFLWRPILSAWLCCLGWPSRTHGNVLLSPFSMPQHRTKCPVSHSHAFYKLCFGHEGVLAKRALRTSSNSKLNGMPTKHLRNCAKFSARAAHSASKAGSYQTLPPR